MNSTVINIKTDPKLKKNAQKVASELGLTLSGVMNAYLRHFTRTKTIYFSLNEDNPSDYLISALKESEVEKKRGDFHSFKNPKDAIKFLDE